MLLLIYAFLTIYCFGSQLEEINLGTSRVVNISVLLQAVVLALGWPTIILSWMVSHLPTYVSVYHYIVNREITTDKLKENAITLLNDIHLFSPDDTENPDNLEYS